MWVTLVIKAGGSKQVQKYRESTVFNNSTFFHEMVKQGFLYLLKYFGRKLKF